MKIAILSDIHANLPALQAVLEDMPDVDVFLHAGDLVGYYPYANEVCDIAKKIGFLSVRGNHDAYVTENLQPNSEKIAEYRTRWTQKLLSNNNLTWLAALPIEMDFLWDDSKIKLPLTRYTFFIVIFFLLVSVILIVL